MTLHNILSYGMILLSAVAVASCAGATDDVYAIPERPIEEMSYTPERTTFEVWGPTAESAVVRLYDGDSLAQEIAMTRGDSGLWRVTAEGDQRGRLYTFQLTVDGKTLKETVK